MATLVLLEAKARSGTTDRVTEFLAKRLPETRAFEGCQGLTTHLNMDDGCTLVILEYWDTREHYERYLDWRRKTGALSEFQEMLESGPDIRYFEPVDI